MTRSSPSPVLAGRLLCCWLGIAVVCGGLASLGGCRPSEAPPQSPAEDLPAPGGQEPSTTGPLPSPAEPGSVDDLLRSMVAAYRKTSTYADRGTVRLLAEGPEGQIDLRSDFSIALERPNKLRMHVYEVKAVCDGSRLLAAVETLPGQVLVKDQADELTTDWIYGDRLLASALTQGFAGASPQLLLLLAEEPLEAMLQGVQHAEIIEPDKIEGRDYYRASITRRDGTAVFWIDQQTLALRRIEFPTDELRQMLSRGGEVKNVSLVADFVGAQLGEPIDAKAFEFEIPPGAQQVKFFIPSHPGQLLGKKVPAFRFVDLQGNPVTAESLAGKIAVIDFWATWCGPCRATLPILSKVYEQFQNNPRIAFLAVSVDELNTDNQTLVDTFQQLGVRVPIARDLAGQSAGLFQTTGIPSAFIIDAEGVVQDFEIGAKADLATVLPAKLNKLLANEDIYQEPLARYHEQLEQYGQAVDSPEAAAAKQPEVEEHELPQAEIAERSQPETFKLVPLWQCKELKAPGNILVVRRPDGRPRLLVVDAWKSVAEIGLDGKLTASHALDIDRMEVASTLRTAVGADGRRYYAAVASAQQRFHLLDENFKRVFSFPEDALSNPHQGIADVQLGDLGGDGALQAYVGYWGVIGVQCVSLEGKRIWSNRSVSNVVKMAIGEADPQGRRTLVCTNNSGALAKIDARGGRQGEVAIGGPPLHWIVAADLTGDGQAEWCGMAAPRLGENLVVGFDLQGRQRWTQLLPKGIHPQPIEPIIAGRLAPGGGGQWLLPGPDGSIHIVAADGKLLDKFNYGSELAGLATVELEGRPVLIVSSATGLDAWRAE